MCYQHAVFLAEGVMVVPARRCCGLPGGAAGWERLVPAGTAGVSAGVGTRETPEPKQVGL